MSLAAGATLGRYRILRRLGAGAMGEVYLAEDPNIDRQLALKTVRLLDGSEAEVEERKERLLREAKAAGRLVHPHVVTLFDAGEADGLFYLAFEFVEGPDLGARIRQDPPLTLGDVLRIAREAAQGLAAAHRRGIVHRDIKPSNILLDPHGQVKVTDFGIAKMVGQQTELTQTGSVIGTPHYLSPEQVRGEDLDGRSDLFSLGVVLYELLSRQRPFSGETITTLVYQILARDPVPLSTARPGLPSDVTSLVETLLSKERERRFATGEELAERIAAVEASLPGEVLAGPAFQTGLDFGETSLMPSSGGAPAVAAASPASPEEAPTRVGATPFPGPPPGPPPPPPPAAVAGGASAPVSPPPVPIAAVPPPAGAPVSGEAAAGSRSSALLVIGAVAAMVLVGVALVAFWWMNRGAPQRPDLAEVGATQGFSAEAVDEEPIGPQSAAGGVVEPGAVPARTAVAEEGLGEPRSQNAKVPEAAPAKEPAAAVPPPATARPQEEPASAATAARPETQTVPTRPPPARPAPAEPAPSRPQPERPPAREPEPAVERLPVDQEVTAGTSFHVAVTPDPEGLILRFKEVDSRRFTVAGDAAGFRPRKGEPLQLPGPGEYYLQLMRGSSVLTTWLVRAEPGGPSQLTLSAGGGSRAAASGPVKGPSVRVAQSVSFAVEPREARSARVLVDGQDRGAVSGFSSKRNALELPSGRYEVTLEASGFRPYTFQLEVFPGSPEEHLEVDIRLTPR